MGPSTRAFPQPSTFKLKALGHDPTESTFWIERRWRLSEPRKPQARCGTEQRTCCRQSPLRDRLRVPIRFSAPETRALVSQWNQCAIVYASSFRPSNPSTVCPRKSFPRRRHYYHFSSRVNEDLRNLKDKEKIYGRLALEVSALEKEVVLLRSELDRIGTNFEKAGESIKRR